MKKILLLTVILCFAIILSGCISQNSTSNNNLGQNQKNQTSINKYVIDQSDFIEGDELIRDIPKSQLNEEEIAGLILMREEEKLARDVYNVLGDKWGTKIFTNIAQSEQTHMNAIKILLDRYNIEDPIKNDAEGAFTSPELDALYKALVKQGQNSLLNALIVGVTIEDLDIKDLNELLTETNKADIIVTYNNLNKGSRNHLRAYMRQVENNNGTYSPQYISQTEFDNIISSASEKGRIE